MRTAGTPRTALFLVCLAAVLALGVVMLGIRFVLSRDSYTNPRILSISSPVISELPPRLHENGSVYDHAQFLYSSRTAPEDMWVIGSSGDLTNVPEEAFHHSLVFIGNEMGNECFRQVLMGKSRLTIGEEERYTRGYGRFIKKGTPLVLRTMFHNATDVTYRDAVFTMYLAVVYAKDAPADMRDVRLSLLSVNDAPCGEAFTVPARAANYIRGSEEGSRPASVFVAPSDGRMVMLRAHFHAYDGGMSLAAFLNGEKFFEFIPRVEEVNGIARWIVPALLGNPYVRHLAKGDRITYTVRYDNERAAPLTDAMGELYVYFSPDE